MGAALLMLSGVLVAFASVVMFSAGGELAAGHAKSARFSTRLAVGILVCSYGLMATAWWVL